MREKLKLFSKRIGSSAWEYVLMRNLPIELKLYCSSIMLFAFVYAMMPVCWFAELHSIDARWHEKIVSPLYFSVITGTTLGYGEIHPEHSISRLFSMAQVLITPVLLAKFLVRTQKLHEEERENTARLKRELFVRYNLYREIANYLSMVDARHRKPTANVNLAANNNSHTIKYTDYYIDGQPLPSTISLRVNKEGELDEMHISRLRKVYKEALMFANTTIESYRLRPELSESISLLVRSFLHKSNKLYLNITDDPPFKHYMVDDEALDVLERKWGERLVQDLDFLDRDGLNILEAIENDKDVQVNVVVESNS